MTETATGAPSEALVDGVVDERFAGLRDLFAHSLASGADLGGSLCVLEHGEPVVDLWGGWTDAAHTRPWRRDTLTNVWSLSKTISSLALLVLIDRGELDPDRPIAAYWPAFGAAGKGDVMVRDLLQHATGVSGWDQPITGEDVLDVDAAADRLAAQAPWWPPGTASGYHLLDYGHLAHGLVRAVTGLSLGAFVAAEVAGPLGADFWLGVPEGEDGRIADVVPPPHADLPLVPGTPAFRTFTGPVLGAEATWTTPWRRAGIGGAGGQGNARGVARLNDVITGGGETGGIRLLRAATVDRVFGEPRAGVDLVLGIPLRWGLGWGLREPGVTDYIPEGRVAFWGGWGGSIVTADRDRGVTFAYVMNRMEQGLLATPRTVGYLRAVYDAL